MLVKDYLEGITEPIGKRTLCFLLNQQDKTILLGKKKKGFGEGNYLGIGGKVEDGESIEEAVVREMREEVGITPTNLRKMAIVTFLFQDKPHYWNQEVHVFKTNSWEGKPRETEEIRPYWCKVDVIPYKMMWEDNQYWLPKILEGKKLRGYFLFDRDLEIRNGVVKSNLDDFD